MYQPQGMVGLAHRDPVARVEGQVDVSVAGYLGLQRALVDYDLDGRVVVDDNRSVTEGVRADGYQGDGVQARVQDRSSPGQGACPSSTASGSAWSASAMPAK